MWRVIKNRAWLPLSCFTHKLFVTLNDTALFGSPSRWLETDEIVFTIVFEMSRWLSKFLFTDSAQHISRCREMSRYWDDSTLFFNTFLTSMLTLMSRCYSWQIISHFLKHWISQIFLHQSEHHDERITTWCPASGSMVWYPQGWFSKFGHFSAIFCWLFVRVLCCYCSCSCSFTLLSHILAKINIIHTVHNNDGTLSTGTN